MIISRLNNGRFLSVTEFCQQSGYTLFLVSVLINPLAVHMLDHLDARVTFNSPELSCLGYWEF